MSATTSAPPRDKAPALKRTKARVIEGQEIVLAIVIVAMWLILGFATNTFVTGNNIMTVLYSIAPIVIVGIAMTGVIVTAGIDVSVGSQAAVVMVVVAKMLVDQNAPAPLALLTGVIVGGLMGLVNGVLVAYGKIHPIIVTFGTMNIFRFVSLQIFGNEQVPGVPPTLGFIGGSVTSTFLGVPNAFWLALVLAIAVWFYMRYFATGRHLYAVGGNERAAQLSGVRVNRRLVQVYALTGVAVGLAGCVMIGTGGLIQMNVGFGLELQVIAAVVIGGTSITGGRGTVLGTVLGALLVGTVSSAVIHMKWPSDLANLFIGIFIIIAVGVDLLRQRRREAQ